MISRHNMLIEEGWLSIGSDWGGEETASNSWAQLLFDGGLVESEGERGWIATAREEVRATNRLEDGNPWEDRRRGILSVIR